MTWLPPRTLAARMVWAKDHPWIAASYFGLLFGILFTLFAAFTMAFPAAVAVGLGTGLTSGLLFGVAAKRRWFERPSPNAYPAPTMRRPWSRTSDHPIAMFMWIGALGALSAVGSMAAHLLGAGRPYSGAGGVVWSICVFLSSTWLLTTTYHERRRRQGERGGGTPA